MSTVRDPNRDQDASAISIARDQLVARGLTPTEAVVILLPVLAATYREVASEAAEGATTDIWGTTPAQALTAFAAAYQRTASQCDLIAPPAPTNSLREQIAALFRVKDGKAPAWTSRDAGPEAHVEAIMAIVQPSLAAERARTELQIDRKIQVAGEWANALADLTGERTRTQALLADLADPDPCWYDHHGYCQAHSWMATEPACPHARAKTLLNTPTNSTTDKEPA